MRVTVSDRRSTRRVAAGAAFEVRALVVVLAFQGVSAGVGGAMLLAQHAGADAGFPDRWLAHIPFDSWLWPAAILGGGLGLSALILAFAVARRPRPAGRLLARWPGRRWSWAGSLALGAGLMTWIVVQILLIPGWTWLQPLYLVVGAAIISLALSRSVRSWLSTGRPGPRA
jgi:hypothetical protein